MIKIFPEKHQIIKCVAYAFSLSILFSALYTPKIFTAEIEDVLNIAYDVIYRTLPTEFKYIDQIILWLLPYILICFTFPDIMVQEMSSTGVYIFTRKKCFTSCYFSILSKIIVISYFYTGLFVIISMLIFMTNNSFVMHGKEFVYMASIYVAIAGLFTSIMLFIENLLAMRYASHLSSSITVSFIVIMSLISVYTYKTPSKSAYILFVINPVSISIVDWYKDYGRILTEKSVTLWYGILYFALIFSMLVLIGYFYVNTHDIGLVDNEED